ncbi:uncharacterized protein G2W53_040998 [Senna tora]|uniref:Uncharacterized protein n=1 Tax=Senna tora TaxID=362788 RepID=A0A834SJ88_9FABA|nr:uncharacterized protein G2W53_040998 [Senna tora]
MSRAVIMSKLVFLFCVFPRWHYDCSPLLLLVILVVGASSAASSLLWDTFVIMGQGYSGHAPSSEWLNVLFLVDFWGISCFSYSFCHFPLLFVKMSRGFPFIPEESGPPSLSWDKSVEDHDKGREQKLKTNGGKE